MIISRRIARLTPSLTLQITSLAKKMSAQGESVVNFAAGEPDFDTPAYIKQAAVQAIREGFTKYTSATGSLELKQAICQKLKQDNRLAYAPAQIVVSCGAKHALYNILQVLCQEGDEVTFACPYWLSYPQMVILTQARPCPIPTDPENSFKLRKKSLQRNINKKTKVLILNSPGNPTGSVYSRQELSEIAELVLKNNLYVISDEIYEKIIFNRRGHVSIASLNKDIFKRTIVVNGVSKTYAMTGWRIGYLACAEQEVIQAITNLQSHSTSNPCSISQKAACSAIAETKKIKLQQLVQQFQLKRDLMLKGLSQIPELSFIKPEGAFYIFCNISQFGLDSVSFSRRLLKEARIAVVPGKPFGRDDYIRLSFATSEEQIKEGLHRLRAWIKKK